MQSALPVCSPVSCAQPPSGSEALSSPSKEFQPLERLLQSAEARAAVTEERWPGHRFGKRMCLRMYEMAESAGAIAKGQGVADNQVPILTFCLAASCLGRIEEGALNLDTFRDTPTLGELAFGAIEGWGLLSSHDAESRRIISEVVISSRTFRGEASITNPAFTLWQVVKDEQRRRIIADESLVTPEGILEQLEIHFLSRCLSASHASSLRNDEHLRAHILRAIGAATAASPLASEDPFASSGHSAAPLLEAAVLGFLRAPICEETLRIFEAHKVPPLSSARGSFPAFLLQYLSYPFDTRSDESVLALARTGSFSQRIRLINGLVGGDTSVRILRALNRYLPSRGTGVWLPALGPPDSP